MEKVVGEFTGFAESNKADRRYYRSLTPEQRLAILLDLISQYRDEQNEAAMVGSAVRTICPEEGIKEFIELLNSVNARYVIVGGYAVAFHGHPRFTGDVDLFIEASPDNARKVEEAIRRFGFEVIGLTAQDFLKPDSIVQLGVAPNRIDIITSLDGVTFDEAWPARIDADLDGLPVHFLSKDLLIRNKRATGRARDLADAEAIAGQE